MKKLIFVILFPTVLFIASCQSTEDIYINMFYDKIEYNKSIYCRVSDTDRPQGSQQSEFNLPVYIIDRDGKTREDHVYYAASFEGDNDYQYLVFDGGTFLRKDLFQINQSSNWDYKT